MKNSYDDNEIFEKYLETRKVENSPHNKSIKENLINTVGNVKDIRVLDLGCGIGEFTKYFSDNGAEKVVGIDISDRVLQYAKENNNSKNIEYIKMDICELDAINDKFDLIFSDMVFNYIENYDKLLNDISKILNSNGILVFSQVHPISTASIGESNWSKDENDKLKFQLDNYSNVSPRKRNYFSGTFDFYHRRFEEIINIAIKNNFKVEKLIEPYFTEKEYNRPSFLIVKLKKEN